MDNHSVESKTVNAQSDYCAAELNPLANEALYQRLVENAVDVIWTTDSDGRYTYLSPQFKTLFGFDPTDTIGKKHFEFVHPDDSQDIARATEDLRKGHAPANVEFQFLCSDGSYKWVMVKASLVCNHKGIAVGCQGIIRDISDLKAAQMAFCTEKARSRLIAENSPGMIYRYLLRRDGSDALLYAGPQCRELFELEPEEVVADISKLTDRIHKSDHAHLTEHRLKSVKNLSPFRSEYRVFLPQQGLRWLLSVSQPSKTIDGDIVWDGTITDITDRKKAEIQLQKANEELEKTTKMKDEFLATMSHELRTPLAAILGINEGLQGQMYGPVTSDQASCYKDIQESGHHLLDLINEVLDLAKVESGSLELVTTEIDIKRLCESCVLFVSQQAKEKNIALRFHSAANLSHLVADEKRVRQILINLLNNALKFTNAGGEVSLDVRRIRTSDSDANSLLRFSITDNGIGMDDSAISTLFEPFSQGQTALNREYEGIGLGLALVKKFTELLSGRVSVESEVGRGTCFHIDLPYMQEKPQYTTPARSETQTPLETIQDAEKLHLPDKKDSVVEVLLAEDNDAVARSTIRYLHYANCNVHRVTNGRDAVIAANTNTPDIILMDIQMPGVDGLECIKRIRQFSALKKTPIIAVTGLAMREDDVRCLEAGANEYLSKPYSMQDLVNLMQHSLHARYNSQSPSPESDRRSKKESA